MKVLNTVAVAATLAVLGSAEAAIDTKTKGELLADQYFVDHPVVQASSSSSSSGGSTVFPVNGWGVTDWTMGLIFGAYAPLQQRWRNYDCRSQWLTFGFSIISYSKYFNKPFYPDSTIWVGLILQLAMSGLYLWSTVEYCGAQYAQILAGDYWFLDFNFAAVTDTETDDDSGDSYYVSNGYVGNLSLTKTILTAVILGMEGYFIYYYGASEYYYFWGYYMANFASYLFVAVDAWTESDLIVPTDPWVLYDAQVI